VTVVGLGAWCDFVTEDEYRERLVRDGWPAVAVENLLDDFKQGLSFDVHEFAYLADGRRLTLRDDRGFTTSIGGPAPRDPWRHLTLGHLERDVLTTVLPDDADTQEQHPWGELARLLHLQGVQATAEELRVLPYRVEFSERLLERVADDT
jgi:hypothetical protein